MQIQVDVLQNIHVSQHVRASCAHVSSTNDSYFCHLKKDLWLDNYDSFYTHILMCAIGAKVGVLLKR